MLRATICCCAVALWGAAASGQVLHEWTFDDPDASALWPHGCTSNVEDGMLRCEITGKSSGVWLWLPQAETPAPAKLVMRIRTSDTMVGQGEAYIRTRERPDIGMHGVVRFPVPHDNQWHEIAIPLPAVGTILQVRLAVGHRPGTFEIDWIRFESDPYPAEILAARDSLPDHLTIQNDALRVTLRTRDHRYSVVDRRTGRRWTANGSGCKALLTGARRADSRTMVLDLYDHSTRTDYTSTVSLPEQGTVSFELSTEHPRSRFQALVDYPPMLTSDLAAAKLVFCDRSAGVYVDQKEEAYAGKLLTVYGNTATTNMPLVGVVSSPRGDAMMALVETPCDALFHLAPDAEKRCWPQIIWQESLDTFGYPRRLSYRFVPSGGYVALANLYRKYATEQGHVLPFSRKLKQRPQVAGLRGAPILWGARDAWRFIQEARTEGMVAGVLANAHHGLWDHGSLRKLNELGYLTAPYDNVTDALDGPTGPQRDPLKETAFHSRPDSGPQGGWEDELNKHFMRSTAFAMRALTTYAPAELEHYGYNAWFMDVALAIHLLEDWHPQHTFDRRQDMAYRRECFRWLNDKGLVVGAEHGNDWGIEFIDWTEGSLGGPFWWDRARDGGWDPGRLRRAVSREDYTDKYLRIGHGYDTRVPFWQLVYHDCAVSTWYWGDGPDFHHDAAPEVSDQKDLQTLLYGGVPILWRSDEGYGWERNRERLMQSYRDTCIFHREVAFARLVDHEFLSPDMALQRTRFDTGHTAVVNFGDDPREYTSDSGETVTLAPGGYLVTGPAFRQTKLWLDGAVVKSIQAEGYFVGEAPDRRKVGPVELDGRFVGFRVSPKRWQLSLEAGKQYRFRTSDLTGWDAASPCALVELDPVSADRRVLQTGSAGDEIRIDAAPDTRFFALVLDPDPTVVTLYPAAETLPDGDLVMLSVAAENGTIRYTLDNSEPTPESPAYAEPFALEGSAVVKARLFAGSQALGQTVTRALRSSVRLFGSPLLRGGDDALRVDVPVAGLDQLRLVVGDGGNSCWSDWAGWADAAFARADGSKLYLSELKPVAAKQTYHEMTVDGNPPGSGSIRINGRRFEKGLCCFSEAEIIYKVPADAVRFSAWVGVDDRANPGPNGPEILRGTVTFSVFGLRPWRHGTGQSRANQPAP
ncbi:MAG: NPCBM/NEW2 domain-containing protein [Armatimonadetes bacterium]|nr:NPCBM/NEW2 domain-containing protein [Armatimonadota bacterium]